VSVLVYHLEELDDFLWKSVICERFPASPTSKQTTGRWLRELAEVQYRTSRDRYLLSERLLICFRQFYSDISSRAGVKVTFLIFLWSS
jgi:hypothetical protein